MQGALYVDGGVSDFGYPLANFRPVLLPGEHGFPLTITPNEAFDVVEAHAVDRLIVNNQDDVADRLMTLTSTTIAGLGMGAAGIEYDNLEVLDILLGSGIDEATVLSTHTGTTTIETRAGYDTVGVRTIVGHTRILGGDGNDTITVSDGRLLSGINAQLLVSGGNGSDTTIADDRDATEDRLGTLTQTSLVGLGMTAGTQSQNLFSLELSGGLGGVTLHIVAHRAATPDAPGLDIDVLLTLTAAELAGLTEATLAARLQAALFPPVDNASPGEMLPGDDDRFATTGCGTDGTTGEPDSRCSSSVFVWQPGRLFLIGFRGELHGLDVVFTATPSRPGHRHRPAAHRRHHLRQLETARHPPRGGRRPLQRPRHAAAHPARHRPRRRRRLRLRRRRPRRLPTALPRRGATWRLLHEAVLHGTVTYDDLTFNGSLDEVVGNLDIETGTGSNTLASATTPTPTPTPASSSTTTRSPASRPVR